MTSYSLRGTAQGTESVYAYTRRRWDELRDNFKNNIRPGVSNDKPGAYAASKLIFTEMSKSPGIVTDALPPDATYLESYINNPSNPLTWLAQKASQASESATHTVAVNLDKPAQWAQDIGDSLPWYTKPGAIVGVLALSILLPPILGSITKGYMQGKGKSSGGLFAKVKRSAKRFTGKYAK